MIITEVKNKRDRKQFLDIARIIYKDTKVWVSPLDNDVESVFDPAKNNFHKHGKITRWILKSSSGDPLGRIAAFINEKKAFTYPQPTGGIGFFECVNDQLAANRLFDTARDWLKSHGMEAMDGPINFGENDTFWGLLVDGFTQPSYGMNYHHPYYRSIFETYGFYPLYEQITNHLDVNKPFPERFTRIANWVIKKPGYSFKPLNPKKIDVFARDFMEIYNDAWKDFDNFVPIDNATIIETFQKMKTIMDPNLIWFSYVNGEPASFVIILPDANQIIRSFNGKLGLIEKIKFLYLRWRGVSRMRAIVMGTKTAYQKHGLESAMFIKLKEYVLPLGKYKELELSWVGDFNDKMLALHEATGASFGKKHVTLRKNF